MKYLLLVLVTVAASAKAIICKKIGHDSSDVRSVLFLNANIFAVGAITILICNLNKINTFINISLFSILLSVVFAFFLLFTQITQVFAMSYGLASLSSFIYSCGFLLPIFFSAIFLSEAISLYQVFGIAVLLISLVVILSPEKNGKFSFLWLTFALMSMIGSGTNAIIQKIHQSSQFKNELVPFIFFAMVFASLLSFVASLVIKGDGPAPYKRIYSKKSAVILMIAGGIVVGGMNVANLMLAGRIPAVIQFPVYNICSMILTALAGKIFFKEKIGRRKLIGYVIGLAAITVIGIL